MGIQSAIGDLGAFIAILTTLYIAEEFGFFGSLIVFVLYWQIFLRGIRVASSVEDDFTRLLVLGLNASIFIIFLVRN